MLIVVGVILTVAVIFFAGFSSTASGGSSNQGNNNVDGCAAACTNLLAKRSQVCSHRADVAAATSVRDSYSALVARAVAAVAAATAALAVASIFLPFPGVKEALGAVVGAAITYLDFVLGQLAGAATQLGIQEKGLAEAVRLEAEAMILVTSSCDSTTANNCILSLPACSV